MSNQKIDHPAYRRLITGTSGTGKSTLLIETIQDHPARYKFIYDHQGELAQRMNLRAVCKNLDDLIDALEKGRDYIVFDPIEMFPGRSQQGFEFFCEFIFDQVKEDTDEQAPPLKGLKLLVCDELQIVTDQRIEPAEFLTICETGRRYQVDVIVCTQAPNRIHNSVRNQFTYVATFRQSDKNALAYLCDEGFDKDQVRGLGEHGCLWKDLKTGENNFKPAEVHGKPENAPKGENAATSAAGTA